MTDMQAEAGVVRNDDDRCAVQFRRLYDYTPEELWSALTDPEQLGRWLARAPRFDREAGGFVDLLFGDDGDDQRATGRILTWDEPHVLEYEWRFPGEDDSIVRFELQRQEFGTLLVLDHRQLGRSSGVGYSAGWHAHLDTLAGAIELDAWQARFEELLPSYAAQADALGWSPANQLGATLDV